MKNQLKQKLEGVTNNDKTSKIQEEIKFNDKMIKIWQRNEEKLRRQMSGMED